MRDEAGLRAGAATRAFVFERMDPTDLSLPWLRDQGVDLTLGKAMMPSGEGHADIVNPTVLDTARGRRG